MKHVAIGLRCVAVTLVATLACTTAAEARTVSLFCSWPNHLDDVIVDVDYGAGTVTQRQERSGEVFGPSRARITQHEIDWDYWWKNGGDHIFATLNRISGQLRFCDRDTCWDPYACEPASSVKNKF